MSYYIHLPHSNNLGGEGMAYRVTYFENTKKKKYIRYIKVSPTLLIMLCLLFIISVGHFASGGDIEYSVRMLFPWSDPYVKEAISTMRESVQNGQSFFESVDVFYHDILETCVG